MQRLILQHLRSRARRRDARAPARERRRAHRARGRDALVADVRAGRWDAVLPAVAALELPAATARLHELVVLELLEAREVELARALLRGALAAPVRGARRHKAPSSSRAGARPRSLRRAAAAATAARAAARARRTRPRARAGDPAQPRLARRASCATRSRTRSQALSRPSRPRGRRCSATRSAGSSTRASSRRRAPRHLRGCVKGAAFGGAGAGGGGAGAGGSGGGASAAAAARRARKPAGRALRQGLVVRRGRVRARRLGARDGLDRRLGRAVRLRDVQAAARPRVSGGRRADDARRGGARAAPSRTAALRVRRQERPPRVWHVASGKRAAAERARHARLGRRVCEGRLAVRERRVRRRGRAHGMRRASSSRFRGHEGVVSAVAYVRDGRRVLGERRRLGARVGRARPSACACSGWPRRTPRSRARRRFSRPTARPRRRPQRRRARPTAVPPCASCPRRPRRARRRRGRRAAVAATRSCACYP